MERRHILWLLLLFVISIGTGCAKTNKAEEETVVLTWRTWEDMKNHGEYLNQVLKEKGYPYEIRFVSTENKEVADITDAGMNGWAKTYDTDKEAKAGELLCLDSYLESEQGKQLKSCLPDNVWDAYKIDGKTYTILSVGFLPYKTVYIWDKDLAEKYDVHPENWNENLWEYADELKKVEEGEGNRIKTVETSLINIGNLYGYTEALGSSYPFVYDEVNGGNVQFLYETEKFKQAMEGFKELYDAGICKNEIGEEQNVFLTMGSLFINESAEETFQEGFWDSHAYKVLDQEYLWELTVVAQEVGICTESTKQEEALDFMTLLYTDADLSNALMWGQEGVDYELTGNVAGPIGQPGTYLDCVYAGNQLIGYAEQGQDPNKKETYFKLLEKIPVSQLSGFRFSSENVEKELQQCCSLYETTEVMNFSTFYDNYDEIIEDFKETGIDKIMEEWNRQFSEYKEQ